MDHLCRNEGGKKRLLSRENLSFFGPYKTGFTPGGFKDGDSIN